MCLGSDCRRNMRFPYFCVLSSLGKTPSSISVSSRWLATSFCCKGVRSVHWTSITPRFDTYFFQRHAILNEQRNSRIKIADVLFENKVLLGLGGDFGFEISQGFLGCRLGVSYGVLQGGRAKARPSALCITFSEIVLNLHLSFICCHGHVQRGHGVPLRLARRARAIVGRHGVLP